MNYRAFKLLTIGGFFQSPDHKNKMRMIRIGGERGWRMCKGNETLRWAHKNSLSSGKCSVENRVGEKVRRTGEEKFLPAWVLSQGKALYLFTTYNASSSWRCHSQPAAMFVSGSWNLNF